MAVSRSFVITLSSGLFCGFFSFYLLSTILTLNETYEGYSVAFGSAGHAHSHSELELAAGPKDDILTHSLSEHHHKGERTKADELFKKIRILCWVMTSPSNHEKKARHVKLTWGQRCNKILFFSSLADDKLGTVALDVGEGRNYLWEKTKAAFVYIYNHHYDEADWILKADDDTYVIVENLRYMLSPYNPHRPIWFGCKFKKYVKNGYMSGGAGYVISQDALRKFVTEAVPNATLCRQDHSGAEDVEIGKCMENIGIIAGDSRDNFGRGRFFPFVPEHHLIPGHITPKNWFWSWIYYPSNVGFECCSDTAVSFHYVTPNKMYELEYFLYHLRPYGIEHRDPFPAPLPPDKSSWPREVLKGSVPAEDASVKNSSHVSGEEAQAI